MAAIALSAAAVGNVWAGGAEPKADLAFVHADFPSVRVATREDLRASPPRGTLVLQDEAGRTVYKLPELPEAGVWSFWRTADLAAADLDGDGRDDLVAVVEYMTGIGPTGADPFTWAAVYLQRPGGFERDPTREAAANTGALAGAWTSAAGLAARLKGSGG